MPAQRSRPLRPKQQVRAIDRHLPVRTCLGCRRRRPQSDLVRITRIGSVGDPDDVPTIVVGGPSSGRGAWLCSSTPGSELVAELTCADAAFGARQFARAWRVDVGPNDVEAIRAALRRDEQRTS